MSMIARPLIERFEEKISPEPNSGCFLWTGALATTGYGSISTSGGTRYAHRASWALYRGNIPSGLFVLHKCDNRLCVNPDHLFLGTHDDNMADMVAKSRGRKSLGPIWETRPPPAAKLTPANVTAIRARLGKGEPQSSIAREYGIDPSAVSNIATRKSWRHL